MQGLFSIVTPLWDSNCGAPSPVCMPDARYFELEDQGQVVGGFYFDLYARQGKRGGAWMSGFRSHYCQTTQGLQNRFAIWCVTLRHLWGSSSVTDPR